MFAYRFDPFFKTNLFKIVVKPLAHAINCSLNTIVTKPFTLLNFRYTVKTPKLFNPLYPVALCEPVATFVQYFRLMVVAALLNTQTNPVS